MRPSVKIAILALATLLGLAWWKGLNALLDPGSPRLAIAAQGGQDMPAKVKKTDKEWKAALTPEQYEVMRKCGTEVPFTGKYNDFWDRGVYACAACGTPLFLSETKYEHGTGWPSFTTPRRREEHRLPRRLLAPVQARRGPLFELRRPPGPRLRRRAGADLPALLRQLGLPPVQARGGRAPRREGR